MRNEVIYRCNAKCAIGKKCFIIKVQNPIDVPVSVLQKCPAQNGNDILVVIGGERPP